MSSLNQLISEIAHSIQQADSVPVRRAIRQGIIHARNELIRHSYSNHNYTDKVLKQRFNLELVEVNDGDIKTDTGAKIKRSVSKVPRPVRLTNNLPFHCIKTIGGISPSIIAHVSEAATKYYRHLPGMLCTPSYDYINEYLYFYNIKDNINQISVESVFEYPHIVSEDYNNDDDEFFLPEDLVNAVKKLTLETFNPQVIRDTNEIPNPNLLK